MRWRTSAGTVSRPEAASTPAKRAPDPRERELHDQIKAQYDNFAGVNLDEEAANLIRFQQAYLAASKVMQMAQKLFDSVLAIAG